MKMNLTKTSLTALALFEILEKYPLIQWKHSLSGTAYPFLRDLDN